MKKIFVLFSSLWFAFQGNSQSNIDVLHYKYSIELNDSNDSIYGRAEIRLQFLQATSSFSLDLSSLNDKGKGMIVDGIGAEREIPYTRSGDKINIKLGQVVKMYDTMFITISYHGIPADGLIISKNKYGHRTFFADNWPNRGHNWIPCNDDPADKASVEFIVTAPQHYQVVANGIQVEETNLSINKKLTHWKEDVPISTKVMVIGVADFAVQLSGTINNCIPVYSWVYPENKDKGFYDYALAAEILPFFVKNVGPYAYKKLANVQSKTTFGGLENANTIFYFENSVTGTRRSESLLAHEIAHQWFGNYATEKSFAHLWLSEGFATYMTILYMENKYGKDTAIHMLKQDREEAIAFAKNNPGLPVVNTTSDYMSLLNPNSYQKGGWVLHMLRRQFGDSIFWKGIQTYYATYGGKTAGTDDLRKIFEQVSGKNLEKFFQQWLYDPGIPELEIEWDYNTSQKTISITVTQAQKSTLFEFPLELSVTSMPSGSSKSVILNISKKTETFSVPVEITPARIEMDPSISLLFEGHMNSSK